ncbi:hypothetical protein Hanom_Chr06g00520071 [Helianthus anomalus]
MADFYEYYKIHISQLSPLGMAAAIACTLEVRSVYRKITKEALVVLEFQEWYGALQALPLAVISNKGLTTMCMMLRWKPGSRQKPMCRENNTVVPLWRIFASDIEGRIVIESCDADEEGWYETIVRSFRVPDA